MTEKGMLVVYHQHLGDQNKNTVGIYDLVALPKKEYTRAVSYKGVHYKADRENLASYKTGEIQHRSIENLFAFLSDTARRLLEQNPKVTFVVTSWTQFEYDEMIKGERVGDMDRQVFTRQGALNPYDPALDDFDETVRPKRAGPLCPIKRWR